MTSQSPGIRRSSTPLHRRLQVSGLRENQTHQCHGYPENHQKDHPRAGCNFGMLLKKVNPAESDSYRQLLKDIEMHIKSIMFEIDRLESLKQKTQRFMRMHSQPVLKPTTAPAKQETEQAKTSDFAQSTGYMSSFQFYRAQRDSDIQRNSQKWISKQYQIAQKQIDDEVRFQQTRLAIEDKQKRADANLIEYQHWQKAELEKQEKLNRDRLQLHKERVQRDNEIRLRRLEEKMDQKERVLRKQQFYLSEYNKHQAEEKRKNFERIKQKSQFADFSKSQQNIQQIRIVEEKEKANEKKKRYIQEQKEWIQNQLKEQSDKKQEKIVRAAFLVQHNEEEKRRKLEAKTVRHDAYKAKYDKLFNEYQQSLIKQKSDKIQKILVDKAFNDKGEEELANFQYQLRAQSQQQGLKLRERRLQIAQEEQAGEHLLKQLEINSRLMELEEEMEQKRLKQQQKEEDLMFRKTLIDNDEKRVAREREIQARKLEIEKEEKLKQIKAII